ncbi:ArfGap-domain-containing protein [Backusella circina FSU 941]|nr:ArfGap-domain-containing protein [Backusella circina FSU 941]
MSTRHARTADKASNEKNSKILKGLLQKTPNKYCADCKKKDARWASWNLGIFVCIRCSGIHRSLGVHISKVKSVDLDTWIPEQVESMVRWGNERANKYWEANLRDKKPSESNMEMWIRQKYEQKRWAMKGPIPDPSTLGGDDDDAEGISSQPSRPSSALTPPQKAAEKPKPKQSEFANLDAFLSSPSSSPSVSHQASPAVSQLQGADFFFNSGSSSETTTTAATPSHNQQNQKHNDLKSSILSLYSNIPAAAPPQNYGNMGSFQQQMAGLSMNNNQYSNGFQQQQQQQIHDPWGSFASATPSQPQQSNLPQGGQFFSDNTPITPKKPERDAFADLLG